MRRTLVAMAVSLGTAACSYIFELPASEVQIPAPDGSVVDAATDAPVVIDAPPPVDVEPAPRFCATQTAPFVYCNDFDDLPTPTLESIGSTQVLGSQLALSNAVSLSPPRSLLASIVRGTNAIASVTHVLGSDPDGLTFSFDMLVSAWSTAGAEVAQIELGDAAASCVVRLDGNDKKWTLTQICRAGGVETDSVTTASSADIVHGRWRRFAIGVRFAPSKAITLDIDGARVVDAVGVGSLTRAQVAIGLGTHLVPTGSVTVFQDNLLVTSP